MKFGSPKPLLIAFVLAFAMVSSLKLSDIVQLRKKLRKMDSGEFGLPEGRKLAETLVAGKDGQKNHQTQKADNQAKSKIAAQRLNKQLKHDKKISAQNYRKAKGVSHNRKLAVGDQAQSAQGSQPQLDNGLPQQKLEKETQKIESAIPTSNSKIVKSNDVSNNRSLAQKRRGMAHGKKVTKKGNIKRTLAKHGKGKRLSAVKSRKAAWGSGGKPTVIGFLKGKKVSKGKKGQKGKSGKKLKAKKRGVTKKHSKTKRHTKAKKGKKHGKGKKGSRVAAKNLRDIPTHSAEKESLALDAIDRASRNDAGVVQSGKPAERKLLDLPSQNEFYEQIVSNYYPTI